MSTLEDSDNEEWKEPEDLTEARVLLRREIRKPWIEFIINMRMDNIDSIDSDLIEAYTAWSEAEEAVEEAKKAESRAHGKLKSLWDAKNPDAEGKHCDKFRAAIAKFKNKK